MARASLPTSLTSRTSSSLMTNMSFMRASRPFASSILALRAAMTSGTKGAGVARIASQAARTLSFEPSTRNRRSRTALRREGTTEVTPVGPTGAGTEGKGACEGGYMAACGCKYDGCENDEYDCCCGGGGGRKGYVAGADVAAAAVWVRGDCPCMCMCMPYGGGMY